VPYLTILTPTYNRSNTLRRCYESLCNQTLTDFQWLIIDDGSTDGTCDLICELIEETNRFPINYYYKQNGGKHTAINYAQKYIEGELVLILDSDDILTTDAVREIKCYWDKYKNDKTISGLSLLKAENKENELITVGLKYPHDEFRSNYIEYRINGDIPGDKCEVIRTDILKRYPFPVVEGEKFLGEGFLWIHVANEYDTIYINKVIYICEYLSGGLTKSGRKMRINNPLGGMIHAQAYFNSKVKLKFRIKNAWLYIAYGFFAQKAIVTILKESNMKTLVFFNIPFGWGLYWFWKMKYK